MRGFVRERVIVFVRLFGVVLYAVLFVVLLCMVYVVLFFWVKLNILAMRMKKLLSLGIVMSVSILMTQSCSYVSRTVQPIGSESETRLSMQERLRTGRVRDSLRVDSLSVSDAVIILAEAHRLCEGRDSLNKRIIGEVIEENDGLRRRMVIERIGFVVIGFILILFR